MRHFSIGILWRIVLLVFFVGMAVYFGNKEQWTAVSLLGILGAAAMFNLYHYVTNINRKLSRFFESVRYSDFAVKFRSDDKMGDSFREINQQFNEVLEAFRIARAEKEANLQYFFLLEF